MKQMRQDLKKTEESGEREVKVRRGTQARVHQSQTLPLSSWDFINRPAALLHPGAEPARPNERRPQSGPRFSLAGSRGVAWSVTAKALPGAGCAVRLDGVSVTRLVLVPAGEIPESCPQENFLAGSCEPPGRLCDLRPEVHGRRGEKLA